MPNQAEATTVHIAIDTSSIVPENTPSSFVKIIHSDGLQVAESRRSHNEIFATIEWFIPTAMVLYIAKPYFESFLSEMGKDHYQLLKKGLKYLVEQSTKFKVTRLASNSAKLASRRYSFGLSILVEAPGIGTIKFLLEDDMNKSLADTAVDRITAFVAAIHGNRISEEFTSDMIRLRCFDKLVLIGYDAKNDEFIVLDTHPKADPNNSPRLKGETLD